jgi:hypothetical protein
MQAKTEAIRGVACKDKFLIQSTVVRPGTTRKDITSEMVTTTNNFFLHID